MMSQTLARLVFEKRIEEKELILYLTRHHRLTLLPRITRELRRLALHDEKKSTLIIESPHELSAEVINMIKRLVGNEKARTRYVENKTLLAGFRAMYKGIRYEKTMRHIITRIAVLQGIGSATH